MSTKSQSSNLDEFKGKKSKKVNDDDEKPKKQIKAFKYSSRTLVYEAVIIAGNPKFIYIEYGEVQFCEKIDQESREIVPPYEEEYPYRPITFESEEEIKNFVEMISKREISFDTLFWKIRELVSTFVVHESHVLDYISSLILFSYFQDKFPSVPYTMFVSDNGSGKSTIGDVFEMLGYRCVNMTDPTTANLFRIFGTVDAGQCMLVLDEAEKIDQDREMMGILKTGYQNGKRVQRINNWGQQEHFHTFGLKVMLAERSPNPSVAKGVLDRTFIITNYKGRPELDIKEIKNPKNPKHLKIFNELDFLRKTLLIKRLINYGNDIVDIDTGLEGRDKELCKPILQLFWKTTMLNKIEKLFEILLDEKNKAKANSLERDLLDVVVDLLNVYPNGRIPFTVIWTTLRDKVNGHEHPYKSNEMETEMHGTIYKRFISNLLRDRFGATNPNTRNAKFRELVFNIEEIKRYQADYSKETANTKISCKIVDLSDYSDPSDNYNQNLFSDFFQSSNIVNNTERNMPTFDAVNMYTKA